MTSILLFSKGSRRVSKTRGLAVLDHSFLALFAFLMRLFAPRYNAPMQITDPSLQLTKT